MVDSILKHYTLHAGDKAPDFTLASVGDQTISLKDSLLGGHKILLVFLRHLG